MTSTFENPAYDWSSIAITPNKWADEWDEPGHVWSIEIRFFDDAGAEIGREFLSFVPNGYPPRMGDLQRKVQEVNRRKIIRRMPRD